MVLDFVPDKKHPQCSGRGAARLSSASPGTLTTRCFMVDDRAKRSMLLPPRPSRTALSAGPRRGLVVGHERMALCTRDIKIYNRDSEPSTTSASESAAWSRGRRQPEPIDRQRFLVSLRHLLRLMQHQAQQRPPPLRRSDFRLRRQVRLLFALLRAQSLPVVGAPLRFWSTLPGAGRT